MNELGIQQIEIPPHLLTMTDKARMLCRKDEVLIGFNPNCTESERNTLRAIMVAHGLLYPDQLNSKGVSIDTFYLQEIRRVRTSKDILLATNISMPERIRMKVRDLKFDCNIYAKKAQLLPTFVSCAASDSSVNFILDKCFGDSGGVDIKMIPLLKNVRV